MKTKEQQAQDPDSDNNIKNTPAPKKEFVNHKTTIVLRLYNAPSSIIPPSQHQIAIFEQAIGYFLHLRFNKYLKNEEEQSKLVMPTEVKIDQVEVLHHTLNLVDGGLNVLDYTTFFGKFKKLL